MSIEEWLAVPAEQLHNGWLRARVPLLVVLIVNLVALIITLTVNIHGTARFAESSMFLGLDVPPTEEEMRAAQEIKAQQAMKHTAWENEMRASEVRNVAVDASRRMELDAALTDEKHIDAEKLYEEAARVRGEVAANQGRVEELEEMGEVDVPNTPQKEVQPAGTKIYTGPSVVSYSLQGRKARRLPVPAYRCESGGTVVVDIAVNSRGLVVQAAIDAQNSSVDECLRESALQAARASIFNTIPPDGKQAVGSITYLFVAQ